MFRGDHGVAARGELVDRAREAAQDEARACARKAALAAELYRAHWIDQRETAAEFWALRDRPADRPARRQRDRDQAGWAVTDRDLARRATSNALSLALGISLFAADRLVDLGMALARRADLREAFSAGRLDERKVRLIVDSAATLRQPQHRDQLMASVLSDPDDAGQCARLVRELRRPGASLWAIPANRLKAILAREAARLEPTTVEDEWQLAKSSRGVRYLTGAGFGPASLVVSGPEREIAAAAGAIDAAARKARREGAPESLDHLRFDLAICAITGWDTVTSTANSLVTIVVTEHPDKRPGEKARDPQPAMIDTPAGLVPLPMRAVMEELATARLRTVVVDGGTGIATDVRRGYVPSQRMREFVEVRDGHAGRFPTSSARRIEINHTTPYDHERPASGGRTTPPNLACDGKRSHQDHTDQLLHISGDANGVLTYTDTTGHSYASWPQQYCDPDPPPA